MESNGTKKTKSHFFPKYCLMSNFKKIFKDQIYINTTLALLSFKTVSISQEMVIPLHFQQFLCNHSSNLPSACLRSKHCLEIRFPFTCNRTRLSGVLSDAFFWWLRLNTNAQRKELSHCHLASVRWPLCLRRPQADDNCSQVCHLKDYKEEERLMTVYHVIAQNSLNWSSLNCLNCRNHAVSDILHLFCTYQPACFVLDWNISTTIWWIAMKFSTGIHVPYRMNPTDFGDPLNFPLVPPWGSHLEFRVKYLDSYPMRLLCNLQEIFKIPRGYIVTTLVIHQQVRLFTFPVIYLNICMMDWHKIWYRHSWVPQDVFCILTFVILCLFL